MRQHGEQLVAGLALVMACAAPADARQGDLHWVSGANGVVPEAAVAYGREADGRPQFVCRGQLGGGTQIGRIESGAMGCSVGFQRREIVLTTYEVLVQSAPVPPMAVVAMPPTRTVPVNRAVLDPTRVPLPPPKLPGTAPPTPPDTSSRRGFDEHGQPYVEVTLPDGTIKRTQQNGVLLIKPDGTSQFIPNMVVRANVQPPTPPSLPDDPSQGRRWVDSHNESLFYLISDMVHRDENEMKKFSEGEQQVAGDDPFAQIAYRTTIADFLATSR